MNFLSGFFKNIFALAIGAAATALILLIVNSVIDWHRGGHLPEKERAKLSKTANDLKREHNRLNNSIALYETKKQIVQESNNMEIWKKSQKAYYSALQLRDEFNLLRVQRKEFDLSKELASSFDDCLKHNSKYFLRNTIDIFLFLLFFPLIASAILYYGFAKVVEGFRPVIINGNNGNVVDIAVSESDVSIDIELSGKEHLYLRGGWCKKKSGVNAKTKLMWKWDAPLVTFAADLFELVDFSAAGSSPGKLTVTAPNPDMFISRIDLGPGRAIVIRPRHLIGVTDGIRIKTYWNFSLHNIFAGKIRQIVLEGDGFILVSGSWGISSSTVAGDNSKIESNLLIGYDAHASYSLCRTETFWHYFRKEASLFDVKIEDGTFVTQNNSWAYSNKNASFIERAATAFLNGIGSILGF